MATIPSSELVDSIKILSKGAYQLLMYYYSKSGGWHFRDEEICAALGIKERTFKEHRTELVDKEYLVYMLNPNVDVYIIGKKAVRDWKEENQEESNE